MLTLCAFLSRCCLNSDGTSPGSSFKQLTSNELVLVIQKVEIDSFSGYKIYPSRGRLFVRSDSKVRISFTVHLTFLIGSLLSNWPWLFAGVPFLNQQDGVALPTAQEPP